MFIDNEPLRPLAVCPGDFEYQALIADVMNNGQMVHTRNSDCMRLINDCRVLSRTPLVNVRKTAWKTCLREWEWFMSGSDNINTLHPSVRHWWEPWADFTGEVRYNYSYQFRNCEGEFDQIEALIEAIKKHPFSRRSVITTWNSSEMWDATCPITNCHGTVIQAFVEANPPDPIPSLTLVTYQRSCDVICGLPHNWLQYWAFLMWLAHRTGLRVGDLHWIGGDVHVYKQHFPIVESIQSLSLSGLVSPQLVYKPTSEEFKADDFSLDLEYRPLLSVKAEMVV